MRKRCGWGRIVGKNRRKSKFFVLRFNFITKECELIPISTSERLTSVCDGRNKDEIFVLTSGGTVFAMNILSQDYEVIMQGMGTLKIIGYSEIQYNNEFDTVAVLPFEEKNITLYRIGTNKRIIIPCEGYVYWSSNYNNDLFAYVFSKREMIRISFESMDKVDNFEINDVNVDFGHKDLFMKKHKRSVNNLFQEIGEESLEQFLDYVKTL